LSHFERAVKKITSACPFQDGTDSSPATVGLADARRLPVEDGSVDIVITSPPYLNAIDYIRGHKFSLIWMGYSIRELRGIRSTNVGTEIAAKPESGDTATERVMQMMCPVEHLPSRHAGMVRQYTRDMRGVLTETKRVLRAGGKAVFVIGNCNLRKIFIENSKCIEGIATELGMAISTIRSRPLPENRRYLPPPGSSGAGKQLKNRMREEVILTLLKN